MNRILLVAGETPTGRTLSHTLNGLGFGVDIARDGQSGLKYAGRRRYSHILIDNEMSGIDALDLFRTMAEGQKAAIGVLLSAATNLNTVYSAVEAGIRRVIAKPVDYDQLLPVLESSEAMITDTLSEEQIADLSQSEIKSSLTEAELISIIRSVDYPFAGKHRLEHFDRDTLERVVHLVSRWCRQRVRRQQETAHATS
ncbi:MAG: response regulator [Planctomycetaceae bacterium]|nr:response regulator [Planctomycetaceae bacterium]